MKTLISSIIILLLTGCSEAASVITAAKDIGCVVTTQETREVIRGKQDVQTNICGDDLSK